MSTWESNCHPQSERPEWKSHIKTAFWMKLGEIKNSGKCERFIAGRSTERVRRMFGLFLATIYWEADIFSENCLQTVNKTNSQGSKFNVISSKGLLSPWKCWFPAFSTGLSTDIQSYKPYQRSSPRANRPSQKTEKEKIF